MHNFVDELEAHPDHFDYIGDVPRGELSAQRAVKILEQFALDQGDSRLVTQSENETCLTSPIPGKLLLLIYTVEAMMAMALNLKDCKDVIKSLKDTDEEQSFPHVIFHNFIERPIFPTISNEWIVSLDIYLKDILKENVSH